MSSEVLHVAREKLSRKTLEMHYAITSRIVGRPESTRDAHGL